MIVAAWHTMLGKPPSKVHRVDDFWEDKAVCGTKIPPWANRWERVAFDEPTGATIPNCKRCGGYR